MWNSLPGVLIARTAWELIMKEVEFFDSSPGGSQEAVVYPVFGFLRREDCKKPPWEMLEISDISCFVVTHVFVPPREYCIHTKASAGFSADANGSSHVFDQVNVWANEMFRKFPTLERGNIHSHPFARNWTRPSKTDRTRVQSRLEVIRKRFLNAAVEIIICKNIDDGCGQWKACCFVLNDANGPFISLGKAEIVDDTDHRLRAVLSPGYRNVTPSGIEWEQKQFLETDGIEAFQSFYFGWTSVRIRMTDDCFIYIHLPPSFPICERILFQLVDPVKRRWGEMKIWESEAIGFELSLSDIIEYVKSEVGYE
jgi:hypothetical protein